MALVIKDRVKETCTGTNGDMALTGAMSGFVAFDADATFDGNTTYYALQDADGTKWEVGLGTLSADSTSIVRTTILATQVSLTDTTRQTFSGGAHTIFCTYPAGKAVHLDASGNLSHTVDISADTNLAAGTGITLTGDTLSTTDGDIVHDNLSGFVANEHIDWTGASAGTIHATNYTDTNTTYTKADFDVDHLFTLVGAAADTSVDLGTFTGSTVADSVTIKAALQALETAVETKGVGDITGVDLTAGTGITIDSETNTASGAYSSTITCTVTDTNTQLSQEQVEDFVNGVLTAGSNVSLTYDDAAGTLTVASTDTTYTVGDGGLTQINFTSADNTKLDGIAASANNYSHTTNANLTGDVTSVGNATTIATDAVDIAMLSATGTASSSTFLRGDNTWVTPTDTNTTYTGGTNLTLDGTTFNVDLVIGTNVQAYDADLTALAGLSSADSNFIVGSASGWVAESGATARTSLGVDAAGTDNSTDVTLVTSSHDYLSISTQAITLGAIDLATDVTGTLPVGSVSTITLGTNTAGNYVATVTGGTGITSTGATSGEGIAHSLSVDASQTGITAVGTLVGLTLDGDKAITPGDGSMIHLDTSTLTADTAGSGTAAKFASVTFEAPTLAATNASVTTTDATTVYISAAPTAGTNQTLTNAWALWVDAGNVRLDGSLKLDSVLLSAVQTSAESFVNNDTSIMTSAAIEDKILSYSYSTTTGTVTSVAITGTDGIQVDSGSPITGSGTITLGLLNIANDKLANSSITIAGSATSLGGSITADTIAGQISVNTIAFTQIADLAQGSILYGNGSAATAELTKGSANTVLQSDGTDISWGTVTNAMLAGSIANTKLANDSVSYGGVSLDLGGTDATPAFDLADATNYPTSSLSGTITNAQLAGSIANAKLTNSSITVSDGSNTTAVSLGGTMTFSGTSNEIEVAESSGTVTIGLPDNVTIAGNLTVNGDTVTVNTATLSVEDPLIILASGNNAADSVDIGFYGLYDTSGSLDLYAGLFRDADDSGKFKLFKNLQAAPTATVNVSGTGYAVATLVANIEGDVTGDVTGNVSGTAATVTGATQAAITSAANLATVGTIGTGVWQGTAIATAYIADDAITGAKIALFDDSLAATTTHFLIADGTDYSSFALSGDVTCTNGGAVTVAADAITYAKMQNVSADERILGRVSGADGVIEELTKAQVLTFANVEDGADVTDTTNVTSAGALMDSEVTNLAFVKALAKGISDGNVLTANDAVADDDFLRINGTEVEGLTVAEVLTALNVEAAADVTDTANVTSAGALMDSELTDLAGVKGVTISTLQVKPSEGAFANGDKTKLDAIEASADVTDTANVTAAGALMDSEVTNLATVKALATGISDGNFLTANDAVADNDFLRIDGTEVEGRTASEVLSDIAAAPAAGSSSIVTVGTVGTGVWNGTAIGASYVATLNQDTTGTAATVTGAAQSAITSVGTLTTLSVDDIIINASTIDFNGSTGDNKLDLTDNIANGLDIVTGGSDSYMRFNTQTAGTEVTYSKEAVEVSKPLKCTKAIHSSISKTNAVATGQTLKGGGSGNVVTLDLAEAGFFRVQLDNNVDEIWFKNQSEGQKIIIRFEQDGTGSRTVDFSAFYATDGTAVVVKWPANTPPTLTTTASKADLIGLLNFGIPAGAVHYYNAVVIGQNFD